MATLYLRTIERSYHWKQAAIVHKSIFIRRDSPPKRIFSGPVKTAWKTAKRYLRACSPGWMSRASPRSGSLARWTSLFRIRFWTVVTWREIIAITGGAHARNLVIGSVDTAITDASRGGRHRSRLAHTHTHTRARARGKEKSRIRTRAIAKKGRDERTRQTGKRVQAGLIGYKARV